MLTKEERLLNDVSLLVRDIIQEAFFEWESFACLDMDHLSALCDRLLFKLDRWAKAR